MNHWYHDARFGMFIHWGLYALPAGRWQGKPIKGIGEQIMRFAAIPAAEYEKLAGEFNPVEFNADFWASLAARAGMKYLVLTAKHHDGFALFDSAVSDFTITKATPFRRDVVRELAEACARHGVKFCVYYSQRQDWHEPDGTWHEWPGQFPVPAEKRDVNFRRYCEAKGFPQVRELLTNYGPIGLVWYDTPTDSTDRDSKDFYDLVHAVQPDCLVCDRVGNGYGDYAVLGDNEFPYCANELNGEVPATMNHTWGFKTDDHEWKSVRDLLYSLLRSVANGCNYLLNIGPDALGRVPEEATSRLREIGDWLQVNGDAVYGATAVPFPTPCVWGMATGKDNRLFLIFENWPQGGVFRLDAVRNEVVSVRVLGSDAKLQTKRDGAAILISGLPEKAPSPFFSVVELTLAGELSIDPTLRPDSQGELTLLSGKASCTGMVSIDPKGLPQDFHPGAGALNWTFEAPAGEYKVEVLTNRHWSCAWQPGTRVRLRCDGMEREWELRPDCPLDNLQSHYHPETVSKPGSITLPETGTHRLSLEISELLGNGSAVNTISENDEVHLTVHVISLKLIPVNGC